MAARVFGLAHCCHHDAHWEWCYDYDERVAFIKSDKPMEEQGVRLANFWLFPPDMLPAEYTKAAAEYGKAWAEVGKAWAEYDKVRAEYGKAWAEYGKAWTEAGKLRAEYGKAWAEAGKLRAEVDTVIVKCAPAIQALHDRLVAEQGYVCTWNGTDIFEKAKTT